MDLNKITIIGNMVRTPELKQSGSRPMVVFTLATNYSWHDGSDKETKHTIDFHTCVAYGKLAEIVAQYVKKGSKLYIEGRSTTIRDTVLGDKNAPELKTSHVFIIDNMIMLGHRSGAVGKDQ